ncbi:MAG: hypothetical protein ACYS8K_03485, partial [Planctomycetota bacterium]
FTHYAGEGAIKSCRVKHGQQEVDLAHCRTEASYSENGAERVLALEPVEIEFSDLTVRLASTYAFPEDTGEIRISRKIVETSDPAARVTVDEYITSCYGTTEYPEDLSGVTLRVVAEDGTAEELDYGYKSREARLEDALRAEAVVPQVGTKLSLAKAEEGPVAAYFREGYAFAPNLTLGIEKTLGNGEELVTCLKVEKAP